MMNLRGLANSAIQTVNPNIQGVWVRATGGYTTDAAGHRTAATTSSAITLQVQAMDAGDLKQVDGLNIQGVMRAVTMFGNVQGAVRADSKGGDILQFPQDKGGAIRNWRVVHVLETWPTWSRVVVVMQ